MFRSGSTPAFCVLLPKYPQCIYRAFSFSSSFLRGRGERPASPGRGGKCNDRERENLHPEVPTIVGCREQGQNELNTIGMGFGIGGGTSESGANENRTDASKIEVKGR